MPKDRSTSAQGSSVYTALSHFVVLRVQTVKEAGKLAEFALAAGYDDPEELMRVARGETPVVLEQLPQLASALGINAGFLAGLVASEHSSSGFLDVLSAALPAAVLTVVDPINAKEDDTEAQLLEVAASNALPFDFEALIADTGETVHFSCNVSAAFHRRFKYEAAMAEISIKRLLQICFRMYLESLAEQTPR